MGRYTVGNKYVFTTNTKSVPSFGPYIPGMDSLIDMKFVLLRCQSEHTVPCAYSNTTSTGYIFVDERGNEYHNQYPVARYGQLDDSNDRIVTSNNHGDITIWEDVSHRITDIKRALTTSGFDEAFKIRLERLYHMYALVVGEFMNARVGTKTSTVTTTNGEKREVPGFFDMTLTPYDERC